MSFSRIALAAIAILAAGFCLFGFLASFEGDDAWFIAWRIGYAVVGFAALAILVMSVRRR